MSDHHPSALEPLLSPYDQHTYNKLKKHGDLILKTDGYFGTQGSYWSISPAKMQRLVERKIVCVERLGESTFARLVSP